MDWAGFIGWVGRSLLGSLDMARLMAWDIWYTLMGIVMKGALSKAKRMIRRVIALLI